MCRLFVLAIFSLIALQAVEAGELVIKNAIPNRAALERLVALVRADLPAGVEKMIPRKVELSWLGGPATLPLPSCGTASKKSATYGVTRTGGTTSIQLHPGFASVVTAGESGAQTYPCGHRNTFRLAKATLIHELSHVWDLSTGLSTTEKFHDAFLRTRKSGKLKSEYLRRSPDLYEYSSALEQLAVNFEYFVLDPQYGCRRPMGDRFFQVTLLGRYTRPDCPERLELTSHYGRDLSFDYAQVARIDYLLSAKGDGSAQRFGHSMILLVVCAGTQAENCPVDRAKSVVLSYQAAITDPTINTLKGITGAYPSQIFAYSYSEIIDDVANKEMRGLSAYPLALSKEDMVIFLDTLKQVIWEYQGDYKFLANNCASETIDLFRAAFNHLSDDIQSKGLFATPYGVQRVLNRNNLLVDARPSLTDSTPSPKAGLATAFELLKRRGLVPAKMDFKLFTRPHDLATTIGRWNIEMGPELLQAALKLALLKITMIDGQINEAKGLWLAQNPQSTAMELYQQTVTLAGRFSVYTAASGGYGIPQGRELQAIRMDAPTAEQVKQIQLDLAREYQAQIPELKALKEGRDTVAAVIKALARAL